MVSQSSVMDDLEAWYLSARPRATYDINKVNEAIQRIIDATGIANPKEAIRHMRSKCRPAPAESLRNIYLDVFGPSTSTSLGSDLVGMIYRVYPSYKILKSDMDAYKKACKTSSIHERWVAPRTPAAVLDEWLDAIFADDDDVHERVPKMQNANTIVESVKLFAEFKKLLDDVTAENIAERKSAGRLLSWLVRNIKNAECCVGGDPEKMRFVGIYKSMISYNEIVSMADDLG